MFDEPFSALDSYLKSSLEQNLLDIFDAVDATVLYESHDIDEACRLCDRICVMHNGHVEEVGDAARAYEEPAYVGGAAAHGAARTPRLPARCRDSGGGARLGYDL